MKFLCAILLFLMSYQLVFPQPKDGPYTKFSEDGKFKTVGQYSNNNRVGEWRDYYENGRLASIYYYEEGKR